MNMDSARSIPIETAGGEIEPSVFAAEQSRFRHSHTGFLRHHRVGHFNGRYIFGIAMTREFDQVMVITFGRTASAVDGVPLVV